MHDPDWDEDVSAESIPAPSGGLSSSYIIRGKGRWGGCQDIQSKLSQYGVCLFVRWDPTPPFWSFLYDTHLTQQQVAAVLGNALHSWQVEIE